MVTYNLAIIVPRMNTTTKKAEFFGIFLASFRLIAKK
jgi:hypothetical protein